MKENSVKKYFLTNYQVSDLCASQGWMPFIGKENLRVGISLMIKYNQIQKLSDQIQKLFDQVQSNTKGPQNLSFILNERRVLKFDWILPSRLETPEDRYLWRCTSQPRLGWMQRQTHPPPLPSAQKPAESIYRVEVVLAFSWFSYGLDCRSGW